MGNLVALLILVPLVSAILIALVHDDKIRGYIVYTCGVIIMGLAIGTAIYWAKSGGETVVFNLPFNHVVDRLTLLGDVVLMVLIIVLSFKYNKKIISLISIVQTVIVVYVDLFGPKVKHTASMRFDYLSMIMILIIGIVGILIGIYAVGYMRGYHVHHKEYQDRRSFFLSIMFLFYGAMFGLVTTQNVLWLEFFWETTSVCSFLLIGYTKTEEAITNCFRALWMNLVGGLGFAVAIIYGSYTFHTHDLYTVIKASYSGKHTEIGVFVVAALAFAAISKTAQFPFSKWLLGAMVAPTPSSALLHSATMVKAGVYLLIRLSPALNVTSVGKMVYLIGGFTFFAGSLLAISQSDGKKVLAYSTISNLGLMAACAGVGSAECVWAAVFLMIFHAVSKSMCFQSVGAIENTTGSRDIEDMQGLLNRLPKLAMILLIGMVGMYLAPFGMLISKWAALKSVVDEHSVIMILFICYGSATTMFYWTKWMTKLTGMSEAKAKDVTQLNEYISMFTHAAMAILICVGLPFVSAKVVTPFINNYYVKDMFDGGTYGYTGTEAMSMANLTVMVVMIVAIVVVPLVNYYTTKDFEGRKTLAYMNGINTGDNESFVDAFGESKKLKVSNWYMEEYFGEKKLFNPSVLISAALIIIMLGMFLGGALV
ncbi:MAG: NADH-quinone oxidoreductase subunit L [Lachnospiraceae bacterium]|nr:NADH-quinone oxidoreductase subunit L [Lachnospiraceae bacterium]